MMLVEQNIRSIMNFLNLNSSDKNVFKKKLFIDLLNNHFLRDQLMAANVIPPVLLNSTQNKDEINSDK